MNLEFITGQAGTGKTYEVSRRLTERPEWAKISATTGIAAINLGGTAVTINSLLRYYNLESLQEAAAMGRLDKSLLQIAVEREALVIDEISMMGGETLDIIYSGVRRVNERGYPLSLILTGDFAQLPPIKQPWAFTAGCWSEFEDNTTTLTKVWRQSDPAFLAAINAARRGDGRAAAESLHAAGVTFHRALDPDFQGTTIFGLNHQVDRYNALRLSKLETPVMTASNYRWGKQLSEWKKNIPSEIVLKEGALVMILANDSPRFSYVNGDLGRVTTNPEIETEPEGHINHFEVRLNRNDFKVVIHRITRRNETKEEPFDLHDDDIQVWPSMVLRNPYGIGGGGTGLIPNPEPEPWGEPYYDSHRDRFVIGAVRYFPLRLAYASTVHKTQGLSLDNVQMDVNGQFFREPAMTYVALSRVRSPQGLRIVGQDRVFISRVKAATEVSRWL